jgi:hypothetical protein
MIASAGPRKWQGVKAKSCDANEKKAYSKSDRLCQIRRCWKNLAGVQLAASFARALETRKR